MASDCESSEGDALKVFIEQQCRKLELSINVQIQAALPAAALYFLRCQEARQQGQEMPPEIPSAFMAETAGHCHVQINDACTSSPASIAKQQGTQFQNGQWRQLQNAEAGKTHQSPSLATSFKSELKSETCREGNQNSVLMTELPLQSAEHVAQSSFRSSSRTEEVLNAKEHAMWEMKELQNGDISTSWLQMAIQRRLNERPLLHLICWALGLEKYLPDKCPNNLVVPIVESKWFQTMALVGILVNTCFNLYVVDSGTRMVLSVEPEPLPEWWDAVEIGFAAFFIVEIFFRLVAYRMWFFLAPGHWKTNVFDLSLVVSSVATSSLSTVLVFRSLRIFRVVRVARVVRLVKSFAELRKLLYAVLACMTSLLWAVLFLALTFTLFSLMIMQGVKSEIHKYYDDDELMASVREQFSGIGRCFKTLLTIVGGEEWLVPHEPLSQLGLVYAAVMPVFVLFVQVGIMNIVIGVFAQAASRMVDRDMVAKDQIGDLDDFVEAMVSLYRECAPHGDKVDGKTFLEYFDKEEVQAYLAAYHIDVSHVRLIFELVDFDGKGNGDIDLNHFVLALLKYKGEAKGLDLKIMMHSLTALAQELGVVRRAVKQIAFQNEQLAGHIIQDSVVVQNDKTSADSTLKTDSDLIVSDSSTARKTSSTFVL